jgi:hypothetical protein
MLDMPCPPATHKALMLPPGFTARETKAPWQAAIAAAEASEPPGTLFYAPVGHLLEAALLLEPDRPVDDETILRIGTLAVTNALLAIVPPEMTVAPVASGVTVNDGEVAVVAIARGPALADGVPAWLVVGLTLRLALQLEAPGETPWLTDLAEEGIEVEGAELLEGICKHLLSLIDLWSAEDAPGIARAWREMQPA